MRKIIFILISAFCLLLISYVQPGKIFIQKEKSNDLDQIMKRGSLVVATSNNPSDYFLFKGEPLGFQLEMLEDLGNYLGLKIEAVVCKNPGEITELLRTGQCDMIASSWNLSKGISNFSVTSVPLLNTDMLLVQRIPEKGSGKTLVKKMDDLIGRTVYVPGMSKQADIMEQFSHKCGNNVQVVEMPQYSQEKLVDLVASGTLDYTICNSVLAETYKNNFPSLDFSSVIENAEPISWMLSKSNPRLIDKINGWLSDYKASTRYSMLLDKYFNQQNKWAVMQNRYAAYRENKISIYDDLLRKYSKQINWDWRLLASLIYQESRFSPRVKSNRGAFGLMQMMPSTQQYFGVDSTASPEQQICAGVRYIKFLNNHFAISIPDSKERVNFILASYNIGPGHIVDAQKLATKIGKNPGIWFRNVDSCLLSKSDPKQYNDPLVQFGYCSGIETYKFVKEITDRYQQYRNVVAER